MYIENPTLIILFIFLSFSNLSLRLTMNDISKIEIDKELDNWNRHYSKYLSIYVSIYVSMYSIPIFSILFK